MERLQRRLFIRNTKQQVINRIEHLKAKNLQWYDLAERMELAHLRSALSSWVDGVSEYSRIL